jgi:type IV secretory pathway VirB3-like protein
MKNTIADYALPVYSSLSVHQQLFGVGDNAFYAILCITVILASTVSIFCIALGLIALLVAKLLCRKDPLLFDLLIAGLFQADLYRGL